MPNNGTTGMIIYSAVIIAIFYFLLIRPQKRKDKEHKTMIAGIKKGDEIVTTSGFIAKVVSLGKDGVFTVKLGDTKVKMYDWAINSVIKTNENAEVLTDTLTEETSEEVKEETEDKAE